MKSRNSRKWNWVAFITATLALFTVQTSFSQTGVGIDAATPATKLDVNGDLALRIGSFNATNNNNNDINIGSWSFVRVAGATDDFDVTGIAGGVDGKVVILHNSTSYDMVIEHQDGNSSAANRIICPNNSDEYVRQHGSVMLIYSAVDSRWLAVIQN